MACASDSSDCDQKLKVSKNRSSCCNKLDSSSEEETTAQRTPTAVKDNDAGSGSRRQSLRKRNQRIRMPSREEQWNAIATQPGVTNKLSHLTPRKLVNDFTRVTHRYNYDYVEVSGEESMEEFIKDTDSTDSSSDSDSAEKGQKTARQRQHRVKGYRPRIANASDSSEEGEAETSKGQNGTSVKPQSRSHLTQSSSGGQYTVHEKQSRRKPKTFMKNKSRPGHDTDFHGEESVSTDDDVETVKSTRKSKRLSVLESDSDRPSSGEYSELKTKKNSKKQPVLNPDSDNHTQSSVSSSDSGAINTPGRARMKSFLDSASDTEEKGPSPETKDEQCSTSTSQQSSNLSKPDQKPDQNEAGKSSDKKVSNSESTDLIYVKGSSEDGSTSGDSAITEDGDDSERGRIQKLAERKRRERDSIFSQLRTARAKRQKKA